MNGGHQKAGPRGFSLVEMVLALAVSALLMVALLGWLARPMQAFVQSDADARTLLEAQRAMQWLAEELPAALPNSARVACGGRCLEFLLTVDAGEYRAEAPGDVLLIGADDDAFDTLSPLVRPPAPGSWIVIGGLSADATPPFGVYAPGADTVRAAVAAGSTVDRVRIDTHRFPAPSAEQEFHVVGGAVSYLCAPDAAGGTLRRRDGYGVVAAQPTNTGLGALLSESVVACTFRIPAPDLVVVDVEFGGGGSEPLRVFQQIATRGAL